MTGIYDYLKSLGAAAPAGNQPASDLWGVLANLGAGMAAAGSQPGTGFAGAAASGLMAGNQYLAGAAERKLRQSLLEARTEEAKEKAAAKQAWRSFVQSLPSGHPVRSWGPFLTPEKLVEKIFAKPGEGMAFDAASGGWKLDQEWLKGRLAQMKK